jgi:hypothetical protein
MPSYAAAPTGDAEYARAKRRYNQSNSCCNHLFRFLANSYLFISNTVDLVGGLCLVCFSIYLISNEKAPKWICGTAFIIGCVAVVIALSSWFGAYNEYCACCLKLSAVISIPLALSELGVGGAIAYNPAQLTNYTKAYEEQAKQISGSAVTFLIILLFGMGAMEVLRVCLSCWLSNTIAEDRKNFRAMKDQDSKQDKLVTEEKQQAIKDKYSAMR